MHISLKLFEIGIPNLVCECILGWRSVLAHFRVTVTLTSDLVFLELASSLMHLWIVIFFLGHCDLDL